MDFLPDDLSQYIENHTQPEPKVLYELNRKTNLTVLNPRMLAGHLQGRVISMLSHMIKPKNVLEIGTYTGYSAICWAEGLQNNGEIFTIDINEELEPIQTEFFIKAGVNNCIKKVVGNALEIIPTLNKTFDVVFIDADKENYVNYYKQTINLIKPGGYIIADNVLWSGKVLQKPKFDDIDTQAIINFNEFVQSDNRVQNVLFPIRDGLMICRKL